MPTPINPIGAVLEHDPETFFDASTGKRRRRNEPLKNAVEAANAAPAPLAPPPPPITPQKFIPLAADVERRRKCSGTVEAHVYFEAEQNDLAEFYAELGAYDPAGAAEVREHRDNGHASLHLATEKLLIKRSLISELRNAIVVLAETRAEIVATTALLERTRATLENPSCMDLAPGDLLALEMKRKHLPSKVAALETAAAAVAATVKGLLADSDIDGAKLLAHMRAGAGYGADGRTLGDGHLHALFQNGYVTLPS